MGRASSKTIGDLGERLAAEFLEKRNYEIVERNFRWERGEIDIIARKEDLLVFVEVKTARTQTFGAPETWVDKRKQQQIGMAAERYLQLHDIQNVDCRFDVVAVTRHAQQWQIRHIENAFWL
ncbi:MAG: YraN family protein [Calditrichaeota bacterium]|nr:MAG: YraN family protein [Calditrichota bacterium]